MYEYLNGMKLTEEESLIASKAYRLDYFNSTYNSLMVETGISKSSFACCKENPTTGNYGPIRTCKFDSMRMAFNGKLSCRGYNDFCSLWGEEKEGHVEEAGHTFDEDVEIAEIAFRKSEKVTPSEDSCSLVHWDRRSSVWNVLKSLKTDEYCNFDAHSGVVRQIAKNNGITLTEDEVKALRSVSKVLTFRVLFGEGIKNAITKFKYNIGKTNVDCINAFESAKKYLGVTTVEDLFESYYFAMEQLGYIDEWFSLDTTKDVTVFFVESAIYILAAKYLWDNYGIKSILKYDSFFMWVPDYITDVEEVMEIAITAAQMEYRAMGLSVGHSCDEVGTPLAYKKFVAEKGVSDRESEVMEAIKVMQDCFAESTDESERAHYSNECKRLMNELNNVRSTKPCARAQTDKATVRMYEIKAKMDRKEKLTSTEMVVKSQFKKNHPEEFTRIFG